MNFEKAYMLNFFSILIFSYVRVRDASLQSQSPFDMSTSNQGGNKEYATHQQLCKVLLLECHLKLTELIHKVCLRRDLHEQLELVR